MVVRFGSFVLDVPQRLLRQDGQPLHITPKAFDLLTLLVAERPRAVPKDEILSAVWPNVFVTESTLSTTVRDLRRTLNDDAEAPRFIRTAYAFGYAFVADVSGDDAEGAVAVTGTPSAWCLVNERHHLDLRLGPNVVGRDAASALGSIGVAQATISRRHACVTVTAEGVTCEDLGSKNGTWVGATRVTTPVAVREGDAIRFGSVVLWLHRRTEASTETISFLA